ncbi:hypothetical protein IFR05_013039 [Cadophora sp. M221]|nr:hypothetical protein IFR05_013039 [Cadophora sp. M221]
MEPLSLAASVTALVSLAVQTTSLIFSVYLQVDQSRRSFGLLIRAYGWAGVFLWMFGSGSVWRMQQQVLKDKNDKIAMDFKTSTQNESNIVAVASTILAQIAITALSLPNLSDTHWVARGFFTFSLVSSIIAVYYASNQYRILGRFLTAEDIKSWIRNDRDNDDGHLPSPTAVLTISAPNMLLGASLNSFLIGLGVYLGFVWTKNLDETAGKGGSLAVFINYIAGLAICYGIYELSGVVVARPSYSVDSDAMNEARSSTIRTKATDTEAQPSVSDPEAALPPRFARDAGLFQSATQSELAEALRNAAKLRRESAAADEHVAQIYDFLSRG